MRVGRSPRRGPLAVFTVALAVAFACSAGDEPTERADSPSTTATSPSTTATEAPGNDAVDPPAAEPLLRLGVAAIDSFDPAATSPVSAAQLVLTDLLYDTLTVIDDTGVAQPALATFSANADLTVWRFELDPDATFADGTPITAQDVAFSLERVIAGGRGSLPALRLDHVGGIVTTGPTTLDLSLTSPSAVLPELLASPLYAITSQAAIEDVTAGGDPTPTPSGDYRASYDGADRLTLDRRAGEGPQQIVVDLFETESEALDALLAGELDWTIAPPRRIDEAASVSGPAGLVPFQGGLMLGVDSAVAPLVDAGLRRAVALAIDRQALADAVFGPTAQPALGAIPAGYPGGEGDACRGVCGPDRDEATALVEAAFPDGQDQPIRLLVDDSDSMQAVGDELVRQLGEVGLDVETTAVPVETYEGLIASGQQQLFVYGWLGVARSPSSLLPALFDSASPDNVSGLADPAIDEALRRAAVEPIASVRAAAWRDVELAILEQVPVVPLVQFRTTGVLAAGVSGFTIRADGSVDLSDLRIET